MLSMVTQGRSWTRAQSRTRLSKRLAIRGVPRERRAISKDASGTIEVFKRFAALDIICSSSLDV